MFLFSGNIFLVIKSIRLYTTKYRKLAQNGNSFEAVFEILIISKIMIRKQ